MSKNIENLYNFAQKGCITHSSRFHADDVLSAALLKISGIISDVSVIQRVGRVPQNFDGLAFDIGGGEFDHHQQDARVRPNGNKYAAFGLLWNAVGAEYIAGKYKTDIKTANDAAEKFDVEFITPMDLSDNFGTKKYPNTLSSIIASMNDPKYTNQETNNIFTETANYYCKPLERAIYNSYKHTKDKIQAQILAVSDFITLPLDADIDRSAFEGTKVKYIIKESHRGTYNITTIEPYKIPVEYIKMPGCVQVYSIGAAFDTYDNALNAAKHLIKDIQIKSM
ncbi:MAG: MYG1 family protein [Alphaproteobacteria bacterium]|nr:MYG1 family protein [Alphaproteobacteria bacterium]